MVSQTTTQAAQETRHATQGRFAPGNSDGAANPFGRQNHSAHVIWSSCAQPEHIANVYAAVYKKACEGNVTALKLYLHYVLGKPTAMRDPNRTGIGECEFFAVADNSPNAMEEETRSEWPEASMENTANENEKQNVEVEHERRQNQKIKRRAKTKRQKAQAKRTAQKKRVKQKREAASGPQQPTEANRVTAPLENGVFADRRPLETAKTPEATVPSNGEMETGAGRQNGERTISG